jgi:predicted ThiF/HesA family dinucleotide-utilizing enzyme
VTPGRTGGHTVVVSTRHEVQPGKHCTKAHGASLPRSIAKMVERLGVPGDAEEVRAARERNPRDGSRPATDCGSQLEISGTLDS